MKKNKYLFFLSFFLMTGFLFCLHALSPFIFSTNDDFFLESVANGSVTGSPEANLLHIGYPTGILFRILYLLIPPLPWYGIILSLYFVLATFPVLFYFFKAQKNIFFCVMVSLFFILGCYSFLALHIILVQYTTITCLIGAGSLFLFYSCFDEKSSFTRTLLWSLFLSVLSVFMRDKAFLMLLPFFLILSFFRLKDISFSQKKRNALMIYFLVLGICMLLSRVASFPRTWHTFTTYNNDRETIYDYSGYPDYDTHSEVYEILGISYPSYIAASSRYCIFPDSAINASSMHELAKISSESNPLTFSNFSDKIMAMFHSFLERHLSYTDRPLNLFVYCTYILFFLVVLFERKKKAMRDILCCLSGRMIIWIYLLYIDRFPSRVTQGVYLAELFLLFAIALQHKLWKEKGRLLWYVSLCVFAILMLRFGIPKTKAAQSEANSRIAFSTSFVELQEYFSSHSNNFYYLDMNSFGSFTKDPLSGGRKPYTNYLYMGSWLPKSPWYDVKLKREKIGDPALALIKRDDVFAVFMKTEQTDWGYLADFYAEKYPGSTLHIVDEVETRNGIVFQILSFSN